MRSGYLKIEKTQRTCSTLYAFRKHEKLYVPDRPIDRQRLSRLRPLFCKIGAAWPFRAFFATSILFLLCTMQIVPQTNLRQPLSNALSSSASTASAAATSPSPPRFIRHRHRTSSSSSSSVYSSMFSGSSLSCLAQIAFAAALLLAAVGLSDARAAAFGDDVDDAIGKQMPPIAITQKRPN